MFINFDIFFLQVDNLICNLQILLLLVDRNKVYNICYLYVVINAMEYLRDLTIPGLKQAKL